MQAKKVVAGLDLGPAADNHSMGLLVATKNNNTWSLESIDPIENYQDPNAPYAAILKSCDVIVIDAPLWFENGHPRRIWEGYLIEARGRIGFGNWTPAPAYLLYSHAWRAIALHGAIRSSNTDCVFREIFPASWFALTYHHHQPENWIGNNAQEEKRRWGIEFNQRLLEQGIETRFAPDIANFERDELDALPCLFCAILICEGMNHLISEANHQNTETSIVFPEWALWNGAIQNSWPEEEFDEFILGA
jgi:predicted nuclease with RNAse H fold